MIVPLTSPGKKQVNPDIVLESRPPVAVCCPHCWTEQRSSRDICAGCGARFIYMDELAKAN